MRIYKQAIVMKGTTTQRRDQSDSGSFQGLPPVVDLDRTRGQILAASLVLFAEKGYGTTTVRDIASKVGLLSGSLYSHFPSKEKILAELVYIGQMEHSRCLRAAVLASAPDPHSQLTSLVSTMVRFHVEYQTLAIVSNAETHVLTPTLARPALDLREQSLQLLKDILARGRDSGGFKFRNLTLTSTVIASLGARVANWYTPDFPLKPEELSEQMTEIACRIVGVSE